MNETPFGESYSHRSSEVVGEWPSMDGDATLKIPQTASSTMPRPASPNEDFEPILIVGHPRSGTTLLATILSRHSLVAIPPAETGFFTRAYRRQQRAAVRDGSHNALMKYLRALPRVKEITEDSVAAMFAKASATPADLFRCLLVANAAARGKSRCGEKSPMHLLAVPELLVSYPRARIVCLIRDGRDAVRSCRDMPFFEWETDWWHSLSWCYTCDLAERYRRRYPSRFLICRFEALVEDPVKEVKRIDEFLGLAFEPSQLGGSGSSYWADADEWWHRRLADEPDRTRAYAWKQSSDSREAWYLTGLMDPWLTRLGYDAYKSPSVAGPRWRYPFYRALACLLRPSQLSKSLTGAVVRALRGQRPSSVVVDGPHKGGA